jgi:serine/threonine-protein kinase RsbT
MSNRNEKERIHIADEVDLMQAVARIGQFAQALGFDEVSKAKLMTVVSELARNILKYADKGTLEFVRIEGPIRHGVEIIADDRGPGIADVEQALEEHFSTSGTLGLGLPGVRRMVDEFEIASTRHIGTRVTVRKWLS